jgi:Lar family restriction alleviation protein
MEVVMDQENDLFVCECGSDCFTFKDGMLYCNCGRFYSLKTGVAVLQEPPIDNATEVLLPCPFCGGKSYFMQNSYAGQKGTAVHCRGCEAEVFFYESPIAEHAAAELWNTRAPQWQPKWKKETPVEPGWYWCRDPQIKIPFVIEIIKGQTMQRGYEWCKIEPPTDKG